MTNRVGRAAKLGVALGCLSALLALTALSACSGRSTGGGGGTMGRPDWPVAAGDWPAASPLPPPVIPAFPDLCSELNIQFTPPADGSQYLACPCTGRLYICDGSNCASSVDCDAVCSASEDRSRPQVSDCGGYCTSDDFCGGRRCFTPPGGTFGTCSGEWCLNDDDCGTGIHCVAVRPDGVRRCATASECNTTADCANGARCALPDQSFVGTCGDGRDYSPCYRGSDCQSGWRCVHGVDLSDPPDRGRCTSGLETAPCGSNDDCADGGKCFAMKCSAGRANEGCGTDDDCEAGLQCVNLGITYDPTFAICSDGAVHASCERTSQCAAGNYCSHGICFDGSATSFCDQDSQCQSGRCLVGAFDYELCTTGEPGAACMDAGDCLSAACTRAPELRVGDPGVCD